MKISENAGGVQQSVNKDVSVNSVESAGKSLRMRNKKNNKVQKNSVYAGNLNMGDNVIEQKRKKAQKMAMQLISNTFSSDKNMSDEIDERNQHVKDLTDENAKIRKAMDNIKQEREDLKEKYGISDESKAAENPEYVKELAMLKDSYKEYSNKMNENTQSIYEENAIVRGMRIEQLKQHDMVDAKEQADQIMDAANKDIIGTLISDVKDKIDEDQKKQEEAAEQKKAEEKELEERIEAAKAEKSKKKDDDDDQEEMYKLGQIMDDVKKSSNSDTLDDMKKSLTQVVNELKLNAEDLKGAAVDENL